MGSIFREGNGVSYFCRLRDICMITSSSGGSIRLEPAEAKHRTMPVLSLRTPPVEGMVRIRSYAPLWSCSILGVTTWKRYNRVGPSSQTDVGLGPWPPRPSLRPQVLLKWTHPVVGYVVSSLYSKTVGRAQLNGKQPTQTVFVFNDVLQQCYHPKCKYSQHPTRSKSDV